MVKVSQQHIKDWLCLCPPIEEQAQIVQILESSLREIDDLVLLVDRQLALFREYRQALITAAVTGQLDIPAEAA
jgi:type I restriction enzyme S subunit